MSKRNKEERAEAQQVQADDAWWAEAFGNNVVGFTGRSTALVNLGGRITSVDYRLREFFLDLRGIPLVDRLREIEASHEPA